ncbi:venom factor-like [Mercenaria mercenaria]|uniref:venom factor-like n=1 Tax=Mercenaria mercenaria TaxID=6596 RepID=UPI00234F8DA3|nr:venom factor-like [Mercenaria mercenaria]
MYNLLLLFGIFISGVKCGYYFVTAPNIIRFNHDETVVVSVFGLNNAVVKVWLQHGDKKFSEIDARVLNENAPRHAIIKVTENDLFDPEVEEKPRKIKLCSEWNGQTQTREVIVSYRTGYLIVQTDKPIYTPQQKVKIRTLALDESLKAVVDGWQVGMDIVSPSNLTMARRRMAHKPSGFYQHEFTLPPYPEVGLWTARAFYEGQYETESRSLFEVREYVLPTYGVTIDVDVPFILQDTADILVTVTAKYVYGKPVHGNARLTLNLKDENGISEYILDVGKKSMETGNQDIEGSVTEFSIPVDRILNSPLLQNSDFPAGNRLEVVATVLESATGKEEATSHEGTIFAIQPYIFKFTRSKLYFRPGWEYFVKVEMLFANGQPVTGEKLKVKMFKNDQFDSSIEAVTDSKGRAVSIFITSQDAAKITFKAATLDERQESEPFEVTAYAGQNQIQVERIITNDNMMLMRAFTNIQGAGYTGMLFMVVTRGQIVYTQFKDAANQASVEIPEDLQEIITPNARLLVFYVDKNTHELVADSIKFDVEKKCRGHGLNLETIKPLLKPGSNDQLTISGSPLMWVGLNVIDKALLLLNDKNVLRKSKMFDVLQSHDIGCGEGSGETNGDVIMKSGLTVLTNAMVDEDRIVRNKENCEGKKRRKRDIDTDSCYYGVDETCCDNGYYYAEELIYEADFPERLDPYVNCFVKARNLTDGISDKTSKTALPTKCIMAFFLSCMEELEDRIGTDFIVSKSLGDESEYAADLARLADAGVKPRTRSDFRESWLFEVDQLDQNGQKKKILNFPDSITEWKIQAVGITQDKGICIADAIDVKTYRDFFVQLDLPYKAVRLEHFDVKATIFSYGLPVDDNKQANIYLHGVEHLCYNKDAGEESPRIRIELPPNSAKTVSFPMIPLRPGKFPVKVSAMVTDFGIPEVDVIEKKLYVVNEGVEEQIAINVCLDPKNQKDDCRNDDRVKSDVRGSHERVYEIDLTLPENSIPQTGAATAYIQTNIMDNVVNTIIEGVESLFQQPAGCGEQTMIRLAPTVSAMYYLKETDQVTAEIEVKGNQYIRDGVNREVSQYRHPDGSYAAWQNRQSSTWLTAFVAKIFCQAKKVVDDAVDEEKDIKLTIDWLKNQTDDGSFVDHMPVIHREMIGQINERDPSLTAFVLITLQECGIKSDGLKNTIKKAREYLEVLPEEMLKNNPYLLAISTYALALTDSREKYRFKGLLHEMEKRDGQDMYWVNADGKPGSAQSVETTSYALLAMIEFGDFKSSAFIVRWLTSQRDARGSFKTTQDTVVGLQALSRYSIATYDPDVDLAVELLAEGWAGSQFDVNKENAVVQKIVKNLPVEKGNNELTVKVSGRGSGIMTIDLRYNRPASEEEECPFEISAIDVGESNDAPIDVNLGNERNCDVCGQCEDEPDEPDYDFFDPPAEAEPKIESNFGRRRRQANRKVRATSSKKCIRFSVSSKNEKVHGMSIVNFGLETGVEIVQDDLEKLVADNPNIARYEMPSNGRGFVVFYLDEVTSNETKFIFRLKDMFEGNINSRQPSSVKVYDYYHPDQHCTQFYGTGPNRGQSVSYECDKDNKQCQCLQSMCAQPAEAEILQLIKRRQKPALKLYRHTCNPEKANYAVEVEIESLDYNQKTNQKIARGRVLKSIHRGIEQLENGDEMAFFWSLNCEQPHLEEGNKYYVIGRDGNIFKIDGHEEYRYPLMGTAVVIRSFEPRERKRGTQNLKIFQVVKKYQQLMNLRGCAS